MVIKMIEEIKYMPKVHLHVHLDGSVPLKIASKLSGLKEDILKEKMVAKDKCLDLTEYLTKFSFPISLMQTKENLKQIANDLAEELDKENVIYAEIRFAPMFHTQNLTYDEVITSVLEGLKGHKVIANLILCLMRGAKDSDNENTLKYAEKYLNKGVCAIDLAGDEKKYPFDNYAKFFKKAKELNIPFTVHAGEAAGPEEVEKAVKAGAQRIGHGINSIHNEKLLLKLKQEKILLEICPTSNVQTNAVKSYSTHPIKKLYEKGIYLNINTDNNTVSNITLTEEYIKLYQTFNFTKEDFKKMNIMALEKSFIKEEIKEKLKKCI